VLPSRVLALEFTAEIDQIHSRQANNTEAGIARAFEGLRRHLLIMLLVTLAAATILAIGSAAYILRLERETRLGYEQVSAGRSDLERLSRRLVAAQEEERKSISRELHDQVAQTLNALLVDVGNLQKRITGDALSQEYLRAIRDLANSSVNSIRDIALLLRPSMLDDLGLTAALDWQAREASRRTGLKVKVSAEGVTDDLPDSIRTCVYRVVQEALQNAARHAQAKTVQIELKQSDCSLIVMVRDDGLGFQPLSSRGLGILGMQERVREAWGILRIDSAPGGGTTVFAEMPTRPTAQARDS
jgi:signal transduction histidine kinase